MCAKRMADLLATLGHVNVVERGQALLALQTQLDKVLPESFRGQVFVADLRDGVLSIACAHNALANRLRSDGPRLAKALSDLGLPVNQTKVRVRPELPLYRGAHKLKPELSDGAVNALTKAEAGLESGELKTVLGQMLRRHKH